tara:strand:- start:156 stop:1250 length:1095 start_codon:yes stop_codon:yes gene_type:complete
MSGILDVNENFEDLQIHTPKAIQGGNAYVATLSLYDNPLVFQTPKCESKSGVHKTNKQVYTDLLFTDHNYNFLNWIQKLEKRIQELIYEKRLTWFGSNDDDDETSMDDIEHNWIPSIKSYKKKYLMRCYFPKNIKNYSRAVSVYDDDENELTIDSLVGGANMLSILEVSGLKFTSTYFNLELNVRQIMIMKEKELFNKCLIKINKRKELELEEENENEGWDDEYESESDAESEKNIVETKQNENIIEKENERINVVKKVQINEGKNNLAIKPEENSNTLVKSDNNELSEIELEIPKSEKSMNLKKPNEVYLEIYKKAKEKAKEARLEAIKAYLTLKEIKKTYLLDEIDISDDESDDGKFLFSEK